MDNQALIEAGGWCAKIAIGLAMVNGFSDGWFFFGASLMFTVLSLMTSLIVRLRWLMSDLALRRKFLTD